MDWCWITALCFVGVGLLQCYRALTRIAYELRTQNNLTQLQMARQHVRAPATPEDLRQLWEEGESA
jgi:hypothetical protein